MVISMQFDFKITKKDYISYNMHTFDVTDAGKSSMIKYRIVIFVLLAIFVALPELLIKDTLFRIVYGVVMLFFMIYSQVRAKKDYKKTVTKTLEKTNTTDFYDPMGRLDFDEECIKSESAGRTVTIEYSHVKKVCLFEDMLIVYYLDNAGFMMPNSCFNPLERKQEVFEFVKAHCPGCEALIIEEKEKKKKSKTKE